MDYPDDVDMEDMDTAPSPGEETAPQRSVVSERSTVPHVVKIKEEQIEGCELVEKEEEVLSEGEEEQHFTETEKQIQDIMEENDKAGFEEDLDKYLKTETSDKAAIHATIQKMRRSSHVQPYEEEGFSVCELFPKKDWIGYYLLVDGHRLSLNTRRRENAVFRCRFQEHGCSVRFRVKTGEIGKANQHDHKNVTRRKDDDNYHYICIYCNMKFSDLVERKQHILNEPHVNAPWPMDEELCVFAEYSTTSNRGDEPADKIADPVGLPRLLPNVAQIVKRLYINKDNNVVLYRPGEKRAPIHPKSLPYPCRPITGPKKNWVTRSLPASPALSENDSISEESVLKIKNSNKKKDSVGMKVVRRKSSRQAKECDEGSSGRASPVVRKKQKDEESCSVPQRIENVIEEYENKVVLHCDICDVKLTSLKHRSDHNMSGEHQENKRRLVEENARCRASLTFNKPIFTEEFLVYNKALEAELRSLRKGAVELEEQNAVLSSHISELTDVVKELRNAKAIMERQHSTLDLHLKDLKSELSKVFASVLSTEVSAENFNETFNKLSVAITGKSGGKRGYDGITTKLKRHLKQARIDTVTL